MTIPPPPLRLRKRTRSAHKGNFGHVLVVGGSEGYTGAPCLAAQAALLSGAGLVTLAVPRGIYSICARKLTEVMVRPFPDTPQHSFSLKALDGLGRIAEKMTSCVAAPGLSQISETQAFFLRFMRKINCPTIVDADGLNALAKEPALLKKTGTPFILTPHPGEMGRLVGKSTRFIQSDRRRIAREFAKRYGVVLVLKGHRTVVAEPGGKSYVNPTGNPGMASGGTGDVLAGILGGLLAQGLSAYDAARLGVYVHGLVGDLAAKEKGEVSLIAGDLLDYLPLAFKKVVR